MLTGNGDGFVVETLPSLFTVWMGAGALPEALSILLTLVDWSGAMIRRAYGELAVMVAMRSFCGCEAYSMP